MEKVDYCYCTNCKKIVKINPDVLEYFVINLQMPIAFWLEKNIKCCSDPFLKWNPSKTKTIIPAYSVYMKQGEPTLIEGDYKGVWKKNAKI